MNSALRNFLSTMTKAPEIVEAVVRACKVLQAFYHQDVVLSLAQVMERSGLSKTTCFRLLQSLMKGGLVERVGKGYRCRVQPVTNPPFILGFAAQALDSEFSRDVSQSIHRVAVKEHIQLIAVNNRYSPKTALRNADVLIKEGVNLVLEFQTYEQAVR